MYDHSTNRRTLELGSRRASCLGGWRTDNSNIYLVIGGIMSKKTYRVRLELDGDDKAHIYRTDGMPTHCCELAVSYFCWEKNTKFNHYEGWNGYVNEGTIKESLKTYNPDNLII